MSNVSNAVLAVREKINATFNFSVDKMPLRGPDNMPTPFYGLFRSDNMECLPTSVKAGYVPHTVDDVCAVAEASVIAYDSLGDCQVSCHWSKNGHHVIIAPSKEYRRSIFGTSDNIFPRCVIDFVFGRAAVSRSGFYRDICRNLAMPRVMGAENYVKIRHTISLRSKMDSLVNQLQSLGSTFESHVESMRELTERKTSVADFISALYPVSDDAGQKALTQTKNRTEKIIERLLRERQIVGNTSTDLKEGNLWELLNAVTGYVQWDKTRHKDNAGNEATIVDRALQATNDLETVAVWDYVNSLAS